MNTNSEAPMDTNPKPKLTRKCPINCIRLVIQLEDTPYNRQLLAHARDRAIELVRTVEGTLGITKLEEVRIVSAHEPKNVPIPSDDTPSRKLTVPEMRASGISEMEIYVELRNRIDEAIVALAMLREEASRRSDPVGMLEASDQMRELQRQRDSMRKP